MEWFIDESFWKDMYDWLFPPERFQTAKEQVEKVLNITGIQSGNVLDLCCGPGRHTYELAKLGFSVTAVDASEFLLNKAKEFCSEFTNVRFVHADMRDFVESNHFDLVINMFTSFGYFKDHEDNLKVLRNIRKSLKSGGKLLMEMSSKEIILKNYRDSIISERNQKMLIEKHSFEPGMARMINDWIVLENGRYKIHRLEHYVYSAQELRMMLQMCGFENIVVYGSLDGDPYDLNAKRLVVVAE
ncbi:class I SAM-dependent methyltransferase [Thermotoga profunda]|uniref:class I SAM-dependent methyltransferase n=1 Tax=Thermotoga profunda TaxID=1508420 RepID=UPI00059767A4|nr:class I SAM-dependent methyltransferase [Thermotoga profunda]